MDLKYYNMNVLDLFCGCGGFTKGLIDSELNVIAGIETNGIKHVIITDKITNIYVFVKI